VGVLQGPAQLQENVVIHKKASNKSLLIQRRDQYERSAYQELADLLLNKKDRSFQHHSSHFHTRFR
jgi:hypothetical protein